MNKLLFLVFFVFNYDALANSGSVKWYCEVACNYLIHSSPMCYPERMNISAEGSSPVVAFSNLRAQCEAKSEQNECRRYPATLSKLNSNGIGSGKEDASIENSCVQYGSCE